MSSLLREGIDYVMNPQGLMVLTKEYLLKRGYCCQSGCQNCPWDHTSRVSPDIPPELAGLEEEENAGFDTDVEDE